MTKGQSRAWTGKPGSPLLTRREALRIGLAGGALACLGRGCQQSAKTPDPPKPPPGDRPVYELMAGNSLYDDFDGHGCYQSFDSRDLAAAGTLGEKIWSHDERSKVVDAALLSPIPLSAVSNNVLEIGCEGVLNEIAWLISPREITFADLGSFSADVLLSSRTTAVRASATVNFHTTIPEQPPGRSWWVAVGLHTNPAGTGTLVVGQYVNLNLGIVRNDDLGPAAFDEWHNVRLDILTRADDPSLGPADLRLEYFLDGVFKASRIPEDSAILIDPLRTGLGPHRSLVVARESYEGDAVGYFDNVRARYNNRIA
jgi:hypothetical protein